MKKLIWIINLVLLTTSVYYGIKQGEIGSQVKQYETSIAKELTYKKEVSEKIHYLGDLKHFKIDNDRGFIKPSTVLYYDNQDIVAVLPGR